LVLIDPVMRVSYNRSAGLVLDADLALLSDAELTGFIGFHLCWNAKLTSSRWSWNVSHACVLDLRMRN